MVAARPAMVTWAVIAEKPMTDPKLSDLTQNDAVLSDEQLESASGGSGFGFFWGDVGHGPGQFGGQQTSPAGPAASRAGVPTIHRTN
jgi:hypothetical protein